MSTPLVSVITRTKNRPLLLERALKSIMNQSFGNFEMVIVNDGGDPKAIDALLKKHSNLVKDRAKLVNNQKSVGAGEACNIGIRNSTSKYIIMHDDDDTWHPDLLKTTIDYLEQTGSMGVVTGSEIVEESIQGNKIKTIRRQRFAPQITSINLFALVGINQFPIHAFLYSRQALKKVGLYDLGAHPIEDWDFNIRFLRHYDVGFINEPLAYYHQRVDSQGTLRNSMFNEGHRDPTNRMLNKLLREDLDNKQLGLGVVANLSNQLHELRMDIKRDQIHQTLILNSVQKSLEDHSRMLDQLRIDIQSIPTFSSRVAGYIKRYPHNTDSKTTPNTDQKTNDL